MTTNYTDEKNVEKAILSLLSKGINPSVEAIRGEIALMFGFGDGDKKGSPNEVLKVKRGWQEKLKESMDIPLPDRLPEKVLANFESVWDANQLVAAEAFGVERTENEELLKKLKGELGLKDVEVNELKANNNESAIEMKSMQKEIDSLYDNLAEKNEKIDSLLCELSSLNDQLKASSVALNEERSRLSLAQDNYIGLMNNYSAINSKYSALVEEVLHKPKSSNTKDV